MFALIAAVLFLLDCFDVTLGDVPLVSLGLFFFALHFVVPLAAPWNRG